MALPGEWYGAVEWVFPEWARVHEFDTGAYFTTQYELALDLFLEMIITIATYEIKVQAKLLTT